MHDTQIWVAQVFGDFSIARLLRVGDLNNSGSGSNGIVGDGGVASGQYDVALSVDWCSAHWCSWNLD